MAERDSFILYTEQKEVIDKLSNEDAGQLIKALYEYVETGNLPNFNNYLDIIIIPFKQNLDRNAEKWESVRQKRIEAGKASAEIRKQNLAKQANAKFAKKDLANEAVNVNVNVNDNVNVNVNNNKNKKPTLEEIENYITEKKLKVDAKQFFDYFETGNWIDAKGNKVKNWKQKLLTWNKFNYGKTIEKKEYDVIDENLSELYEN